MDYKLYTLVDITHTGQYRLEPGREQHRYKEQNFNTIVQTLGLRSNIFYRAKPQLLEVCGKVVGFATDEIIRVWRFDWTVEQDDLYLKDGDPVGFLKQDFHLIPYIKDLDELMEQQYAVFVTENPGSNIVFHVKQ
jgi:predicted ribosome-associated RNA-binding protein Tma20